MGIIVLCVTFVAAISVTYLIINCLAPLGLLDIPNHRSSHLKPVPTLGGLGFIFAYWIGVSGLSLGVYCLPIR